MGRSVLQGYGVSSVLDRKSIGKVRRGLAPSYAALLAVAAHTAMAASAGVLLQVCKCLVK